MIARAVSNKEELSQDSNLSVRSVNWHVWPYCNYRCKFCFARFATNDSAQAVLKREEGLKLISQLVCAGMEKITFVGGEPLLCPHLGEYLARAKALGCITMIVSNASLITERFIERYNHVIDWIGVSMDSAIEATEIRLGRGYGEHLANLVSAAKLVHDHDIKLKVNVTITRQVLREDLHEFLNVLQPDRLKFLQVLPVKGQNDMAIERLAVSKAEFYRFVEKHSDLSPTSEDNEMMRGSYVMVDPVGRFFQNTQGIYKYSDPIQDIGTWEALRQVGFSWKKLVKRGGSEYYRDNVNSGPIHRSSELELVEGF
ncbi:MAG: viperin family antiviral radical SAM protein [Candidatus Thorarchaeota archaeon]